MGQRASNTAGVTFEDVVVPKEVTHLTITLPIGNAVVLWVEHRTSDRENTGLTVTRALLRNNLRQVVHILMPLSSSSISWYLCKNREGNSRLCKMCGLPSITLSVSSLSA